MELVEVEIMVEVVEVVVMGVMGLAEMEVKVVMLLKVEM